MNVTISERKEEVVLFLKAENMAEAAQLLRISGAMVKPNSGFASFGGDEVSGWLSVPRRKVRTTKLDSGRS